MIKVLGKELASKIDKEIMPSTGFIRLAIKDDHGDAKDLSIKQIQYTMNNGLKKRLIGIKIQNLDEVISFMNKKLLENQALLTLTNF